MEQDIVPIDLGFVNAFLLRAKDGFVLIDTGLPQQWEALDRALTAAGCSRGKLALVVVTHGDLDHYGNCARLQKEYGAKVGVHREDAPVLRTGIGQERRISGLIATVIMGVLHFFQRFGGPPQRWNCEPDLLLEDGQDLGPFGLEARVLALPGHTRGSIGVLMATGDFFVGDLLGNRPRPAPSFYIENTANYRRSLERVQAMTGIGTVYPGHGRPFGPEALPGISLRPERV
ncbi:MAG TPA: MBL fold metallo-hydrolase [Rectinemataceae bacterium]|nr:MBL fold metallo-hydrolase [Rectinemataceae bacterium]